MMDKELQEISSLLRQRAFAQAEQRLRKLLAGFPEQPAVHRMLALLASGMGRNTEALQHMTRASALAPESAEFHFQLGSLLAAAGHYAEGLEHFTSATRLQPGFAEAWHFQGISLVRMQRDREALPALRRARQIAPENPRILEALAEAEFRCGYPADALPLWEHLQQVRPGDTHIVLRKGETLSRLGFRDRSIATYQAALEQLPDSSELWMALAQAQEDQGDREAARQAFERALALRPGWAFPLGGLLGLQRGQAPQALIDSAIALLASSSLSDHDRSLVGYELGKAFDAKGEYAAAISAWEDANTARRRMTGPYDPAELQLMVEQAMGNDQTSLPARSLALGNRDSRFVFIVGMPRSGTTLTEQIIAAHPLAFGCGELPDMALIVRDLQWPKNASGSNDRMLQQAIARYVDAATRHSPAEAVRLIDKAPLNFFHLDLIALLFPGARVIWCRRDPRDIAISIYGENFALNEKYASDFSDIAHYIEMQQRLMRHWQRVLPIPILESSYEQLATSIEPEARRIVDFTGLPWDPACLEFHLSNRGVQTPSRWQVKQPIHTRSIGRWRNYAPALGPAFDSLESCCD
jgi:tetratricopeptide (TPR) repeat protein